MIKKPLVKHAICLSVILMLLFALFLFTSSFSPKKIYIFEDMAECEAFRTMSDNNGTFTEYTDRITDDNLSNLSYVSCLSGKYLCDKYNFEIFAYEFENEESARAYFKNCTGKNTNDLRQNFSLSSGLFRSHLAVLKGTKAYVVSCPTKYVQDVLQVLEKCFSDRIV